MKKFNLDEAKMGKEVITRSKKAVKILHYERDNPKFPVVAIIDNKDVVCYTIDGKFFYSLDKKDSENDLFMKH